MYSFYVYITSLAHTQEVLLSFAKNVHVQYSATLGVSLSASIGHRILRDHLTLSYLI